MTRQSFIIGRGGDIKLYDDTVSRSHACLEIEGGALFLRDLESRNGTYEIRDKKLVPFDGGEIRPGQVFAFGECVRSVAQLLGMLRTLGADTSAIAADIEAVDPLDATHAALAVPACPRLSGEDIVALLDQVDEALAGGTELEQACREVGIAPARYQRWREEHAAARGARGHSSAALRSENERLRKLVADLSLERAELKEALERYTAGADEAIAAARLSLVNDTKG